MPDVDGTKVREISEEEIQALLDRIRPQVDRQDYEVIEVLIRTMRGFVELLEDKSLSIQRLRRMLFGASTENTEQVLGRLEESERGSSGSEEGTESTAETGGADETTSDQSEKTDSQAIANMVYHMMIQDLKVERDRLR